MRGAENNDFFGEHPLQPREKVYDWQGVDDVSIDKSYLLYQETQWLRSVQLWNSSRQDRHLHYCSLVLMPCVLVQALQLALKMEKDVTARMKAMVDICSVAGEEDHQVTNQSTPSVTWPRPHLWLAEQAGDWITGTWMEEQYAGQRKLAGMINTFNNFKSVLSFKFLDILLIGELSEKIWF